jgi:hypothetical protein
MKALGSTVNRPHERRGKARMNDFGAMDTVEKLSDAEVEALQPRLRRVRRGLEL